MACCYIAAFCISQLVKVYQFLDVDDAIRYNEDEPEIPYPDAKSAIGEYTECDKRDASLVLSLSLSGLTCSACSSAVESALRSHPDVDQVRVSLALQQATLIGKTSSFDTQSIMRLVTDLGYGVELGQRSPQEVIRVLKAKEEIARLKSSLSSLAGCATVNQTIAFLVSIGQGRIPSAILFAAHVLCAGLALFAQWQYIPWIHEDGWKAICRGQPNMNTLVSSSISLGTFISFIDLLAYGTTDANSYYTTVMGLALVVVAGRYIELMSRRTTSEDLLRVYKPLTQKGTSSINQALITGEALPVQKSVGDFLLGGTRNLGKELVAVVDKEQGNSFYSQLVHGAVEAAGSKDQDNHTVDRVTKYLVGFVMTLGVVVPLKEICTSAGPLSYEAIRVVMARAMTILTCACPCALGLAIPSAVVAAVDFETTKAWKKLITEFWTYICAVEERCVTSHLIGRAVFAAGDTVREDAEKTIQQLRRKGYATHLLTGGMPHSAHRISQQLKLPVLASEATPQDKLDLVERLQKEGKVVAMVGDGLNDGLSLAVADVGIALYHDVATPTVGATVFILNSRLDSIPLLLEIAQLTMKQIRYNLVWVFGYNALALSMASGFFSPCGIVLTPPLAAASYLPTVRIANMTKPSINFKGDFVQIIDGQSAPTKETRHGLNPANLQEMAKVPVATQQDLDRAVAAARKAFKIWSKIPYEERRESVLAFAGAVDSHRNEFQALLTAEQGKPVPQAAYETDAAIEWMRGMAQIPLPEDVLEDTEQRTIISRHTPIGVVAALVPWNFPLLLATGKIAPALLTGNVIIVKPSPFTPYGGLKLVELAQQFFPPGVVQSLSGDDKLGPWMTSHPGVDKISFTGSTATGKAVLRSASSTLKRVTLELGGNDPAIIFPDVDIDKTAEKVAFFAFLNSGQICLNLKRIFVHQSIYPQFKEALVKYVKSYTLGDGSKGGVTHGPLQNAPQFKRVKGFFEDIEKEGWNFAVGGKIESSEGYFVTPTIIDVPPETSRIVVEEPFGPIVPLLTWSSEEEVIERANDTTMGLGASIWCNDIRRAHRIAREIQAGNVWVNTHFDLTPMAAFGGHKESGIGNEWGANGTALIVPWQNTRLTYEDLEYRSSIAAKALLNAGLKHGDAVGIFAGNRFEYIELFLASARIGCPFVVFNTTNSPHELCSAVARSDCKALFIASSIGSIKTDDHVYQVATTEEVGACLEQLIMFDRSPSRQLFNCHRYEDFLNDGTNGPVTNQQLERAEIRVRPSDVLNMQFTSGTTGLPKVSMLTHKYVGHAMRLTQDDVICCPPPLFHCFGLVMGFLASFTHGSTIVFPSDRFNARQTLDAVEAEKATALLGVPTMFISELEQMESQPQKITTVRTGLVAGSPVLPSLMNELRAKMNVRGMLIAYGMTETSPVTFITSLDDPDDRMLTSLGRVLPHTAAKIVDTDGNIVPIGERGEICTSGFALQKGYYKDEVKTQESMRHDENGVLWMHTGDEGYLDEEGYGFITGRIKDLIIRGGENLSPSEIENQLLRHPAVREACVVAVKDRIHGEVVAAFLQACSQEKKPSDGDIRDWVLQDLSPVKVPAFIFWLGHDGVDAELPKTGSGKYQKHIIRDIAYRLAGGRST
ncbi:aldehyde dehydrogenase [Fusarium mexicanum]|uniref:Putative aldehyde dehydrogenase FUS7 n=1 Tax=Fusarium mexicanum TaxID=751941 RepID=A0A8H5J5H5_9HYPO|nr:aldehyde dehydrogenase [Fusarium mexicanum]